MNKLGRNDPCHCGRGKKYKRCHLAADEKQSAPAHRPSVPEADLKETREQSPLRAADPGQIIGLLKGLKRKASTKGWAGFSKLLPELQPVLEFMERQPAIEAASLALEAHRAEFFESAKDHEAHGRRSSELFAEARFAPLRFTANDVRRAFEQVGQPAGLAADDRTVEIVRAAILYLADDSRRKEMAMALLMHMPDLVADHRYLDGWLIQQCAHDTTEAPDESNPFLFAMFSHGYEAWATEHIRRNEEMIRELGIDPARVRSMSLAEVDAWVEQQRSDPALLRKMAASMTAHPDQQAMAMAEFEAMERDSVQLLDRPDASVLLLAGEDLEPWLPALNNGLASIVNLWNENPGGPPTAEASRAFADVVWPIMGEMAGSLFTPERLRRLIDQLKAYRDERFAAGEKQIVNFAMGAIFSLEREHEPAHSHFLNALCFYSMIAYSKSMRPSIPEETAASAAAETESDTCPQPPAKPEA